MPILPGPGIEENRALRSLGLDAYPSSTGEVLSVTAEDAWTRNPGPTLKRAFDRTADLDMVGVGAEFGAEALGQEKPRPSLSRDAANEKFGIKGELSFDADTPESAARELHELKRAELQRKAVLQRARGGFVETAGQLGVGLGVSVLDPLNIASAFIPVVGPARMAIWAQRFGTTGARALRGGVEGFTGAAVVEPVVLAGARYEQADYDHTDSLLNLAFGTVLGGGLHVGLGKVGDMIGRLPFRQREEGFRAAVAEFAETGAVNRAEGFVAYHGSPYEFTAFDLSKVGTGEGAQAYGHGLYFAENRAVAEDYRKMAAGHIGSREQIIRQIAPDAPDGVVGQLAAAVLGPLDKNDTPERIVRWLGHRDKRVREYVEANLSKLTAAVDRAMVANGGKLYEVRIKADKEKMLDWNKPLGEQTPSVRNIINKKFPELTRTPELRDGKSLYQKLSTQLGGDAAASSALKEAGIPGLKYLDQGSRDTVGGVRMARVEIEYWRSVGDAEMTAKAESKLADAIRRDAESTRNFVLFDDKLVEMADAPRPPAQKPSPNDGHNQDDLTLSRTFDRATEGEVKPEVERLKEAVEEAEADAARLVEALKPTRGASPYVAVPKKPVSLIEFIRKAGGLKDAGGDLRAISGGSKARPGLINNKGGRKPDDIALQAWELGYFPGNTERPGLDELYAAIDEEFSGHPRFSEKDEQAALGYSDARRLNDEVDQLSSRFGVSPEGKTREQFMAEVDKAARAASDDEIIGAARSDDEAAKAKAEEELHDRLEREALQHEQEFAIKAEGLTDDIPLDDIPTRPATDTGSGARPDGLGGKRTEGAEPSARSQDQPGADDQVGDGVRQELAASDPAYQAALEMENEANGFRKALDAAAFCLRRKT